MPSTHISRRRMLKGLGACIALPVLEAMIPKGLSAFPRQTNYPIRMAALFMPNGVHPHKWSPEGLGRDFKFSPILQPLTSVKDKVLVLGELMNKNSDTKQEGHYTKTANILTSMRISKTVEAAVDCGGPSVDQIMAQHIGHQTLFPSLQYGVDRIKSGVCTSTGFTQLYGSSISWKNRTQPCTRESDPRMAFDRLFRRFIPGAKELPPDPHRKSVLDIVYNDAKKLKKDLGIKDQNKLSEYLESIRSVEQRLENLQGLKDFEANITPDIRKELVRMNIRIDDWAEYSQGVDITEKTRLMLDIMVLAFQSDASRIATFMMGNAASNRNFSFLPEVRGNFHSISHHRNDPRQMVQYEAINRWHIEQYAYFLNRLDGIQEGDGTLLDHSMILWGSGLRDGNRHSPKNLPIVLAGKGGGKLATGQHIQFAKNTPLANLHQTMLTVMGVNAGTFADSTGELCEILV